MRRSARAIGFAVLAMTLAGCAERPDPTLIEGHWVAEKFRVQGFGLPIGPDLHIAPGQLELGGDVAPVKLRGISAEGKEVTLQTEIGLDIVFAFETKDRMYFSIPIIGDRIYYQRDRRVAAAPAASTPSAVGPARSAAPSPGSALPAEATIASAPPRVPANERPRPDLTATAAVTPAPTALPASLSLPTGPSAKPAPDPQTLQPISETRYKQALQAMTEGDQDAALRSLSAALAAGFSDWQRIDAEPLFARLTGDVRFQVLHSRWKKPHKSAGAFSPDGPSSTD
jgi:hypothetical protein